MTFSEMVTRCAEILDINIEEDSDFINSVKHAINVAYMTVARDKWRPVKCEEMDVCDGKIPIRGLSENYISLKSVWSSGGIRMGAWTGKDYIHIIPSCYKANVVYYYLPVPLENDDDEPIIPSQQVDPYAYIYFAAAFYLNIKHRHNEASVWDSRYRGVVENVKEMRASFIMPKMRWQ